MRQRDLDTFRKLLEERLNDLRLSSKSEVRNAISLGARDDGIGDEGDEATRTQTLDLRINLTESGAVLAGHIDSALERMSRGEYGTCTECGAGIDLKRLTLVPWADRCIECQEAFEFQARDRSPSL